MEEDLMHAIEERGWRGRLVSVERLRELRDAIQGQHESGLLDEGLYGEYFTSFEYSPPETLPRAKSVILVTVPQPQIRLTFHWKGQTRAFIVPPTYLYWRETRRKVEDALTNILEPAGYHIAPAARVPQKLLAARCGLAAYGRNNIAYVDGLGSFHRPVAFFSDVPCADGEWREPEMMELCQQCTACIHACPTGAITADRFLIHAERCLTFLNEKPGDVSFPAWVDPSWHSCVIGCMRCQNVCPADKDVLAWVEEGGEFSENETALLLEGRPMEELPADMTERLRRTNLDSLHEHLARNLSALLVR